MALEPTNDCVVLGVGFECRHLHLNRLWDGRALWMVATTTRFPSLSYTSSHSHVAPSIDHASTSRSHSRHGSPHLRPASHAHAYHSAYGASNDSISALKTL